MDVCEQVKRWMLLDLISEQCNSGIYGLSDSQWFLIIICVLQRLSDGESNERSLFGVGYLY